MAHVGQELRLGERGFFELLVEREQGGVAFHELLLALAQGPVGGVTLHLVQVGAGMMAEAGHQFDLVRQFHQIIACARGERIALCLRIIVGGEHDDRDVPGLRVIAEMTEQRQPVQPRHNQVHQDHGGLDLRGDMHRFARVGTVMEINGRFIRQRTANRFAHHGLVVHQQHHGVVLARRRDRERGVGNLIGHQGPGC